MRESDSPRRARPILDRALFEAVQEKLAAGRRARQLTLRGSPAILAGLIFDDRGNRMTPTHSNKRGARYRYYVSHALLQKRAEHAGSVRRVPAEEVEAAVITAVRDHLEQQGRRCRQESCGDRELIEQGVDRVIVRPETIEIYLRSQCAEPTDGIPQENSSPARGDVLSVRWESRTPLAKGVLHSPSAGPLSRESRDNLLTAIAKARSWIDDLVTGRASSLAEIAGKEGRGERHVRLLAPLAFVPPPMISRIIDGTLSHPETITALAKHVPYLWS
jgi:hypothetical protein